VLLLLSPGGFVIGSGGSMLPVIRSVLNESTSRTRDARWLAIDAGRGLASFQLLPVAGLVFWNGLRGTPDGTAKSKAPGSSSPDTSSWNGLLLSVRSRPTASARMSSTGLGASFTRASSVVCGRKGFVMAGSGAAVQSRRAFGRPWAAGSRFRGIGRGVVLALVADPPVPQVMTPVIGRLIVTLQRPSCGQD
jgi:hypothetical protein